MPAQKTERQRKDVRVMLSLSPEIAKALKERAETEATPRSVLIRRWIVRELREGRDRG